MQGASVGQSASMGQSAQSEICPVGCILFVPLLSVCTGDISTKAMVGVDIVA